MTSDFSYAPGEAVPFKAETRQLLEILIHSLYTDREVFLRELISNASDAITRLNFEMLTNHDVVDPEAEAAVWISSDEEANTLTITDTGIGMNAAELAQNLGTIAHSGARAFLQAAEEGKNNLADIIGQFGVGFYSAFMVADSIEVISRSYRPTDQAARWVSTGQDTYSIEPAEKVTRGTQVIIHLKEDAKEFAQTYRLRQIIKKHSNYVPHPIYLGTENELANEQNALWRQQPNTVSQEQYQEFYRQFTLDMEDPLMKVHMAVDAPVQLYALLFIPASSERGFLSIRKEEGIKLHARKILIQEYCKDLLPNFLRFMDGVVDSEDLPLNVSRESIQSNRIMAQLKKIITNKVIDQLKAMSKDSPQDYEKFWSVYGRYIREGIAMEMDYEKSLLPLLRFHTLNHPNQWVSLEDYLLQKPASQEKIYYLLGEDERALLHSPHLEMFKKQGVDVLLMADPIDPFMLIRFTEFDGVKLANVSNEELPEQPQETETSEKQTEETADVGILERFKTILGEKVLDVRSTTRLVESPARLVDKEGSLKPEYQRMYRLLNQEFETPERVLEVNLKHPLVTNLSRIPQGDPLENWIIEQIYEDALLIEGLHPNPTDMIDRIQRLMEAALKANLS